MITDVSVDNLITITFSEYVIISNYTNFEKSLKSYIHGSMSPYQYDMMIKIEGVSENVPLIQFFVSISNLQSTLYGNKQETIDLWFTDQTVIEDLNGNILNKGSMIAYLNEFEFISPIVVETINSGGRGLMYSVMTLFSTNMAIKFVVSSS